MTLVKPRTAPKFFPSKVGSYPVFELTGLIKGTYSASFVKLADFVWKGLSGRIRVSILYDSNGESGLQNFYGLVNNSSLPGSSKEINGHYGRKTISADIDIVTGDVISFYGKTSTTDNYACISDFKITVEDPRKYPYVDKTIY